MKFTLTIDSENDALAGDDAVIELRRLVGKVHHRLQYESPPTEGGILDVNGNTVGHWTWRA